jgi:23S rRNA pseudouridine1911/1915/1917 synthase
MIEMNILFEDENFIAFSKPHGVPSQADKSGDESIVSIAEKYTKKECHIINRLDRPVGGVCLLAKNKKAAGEITKLMQDGGVEKYYTAITCGIAPEKAYFEDYLMKNQRENVSKIVNKGNIGAKIAKLELERLSHNDKYSLVKIKLLTGRHHQIRAQLAHHGLPLYGDTKYNPEFRFKRGVNVALFACELNFTHPFTHEKVSIKDEPNFDIDSL